MQHFYNQKKILITGHTGFKGAWLSKILKLWGADVFGISLPPSTSPNLFEAFNFQYDHKNYFVDIRDFNEVRKILIQEQPQIIFHLAAQALVRESYNDPLNTISTNVLGTASILQAAKEVSSIKSIVVITTDKVYENKEWVYPYRETDSLGGYDPYSASKAAADIITHSYLQSFFNPAKQDQTLIGIARAGNVIGGGDWAKDRLIPDIIRSIFVDKKEIIIRSPEAIRPWQHVFEPLEGYLLLGKELFESKTDRSAAWNFGPYPDNFIPVRNLVATAIKILGKGSMVVQPDHSKHEANILKLDINKATTNLKWQPRLDINTTLNLTFEWYKTFYSSKDRINTLSEQQINKFFKHQG